jgi:hypothetical protein
MTKFEVGDGACIRTGSDVRAYTVIAVTPSGKTVTLQRAEATVTKPAAYYGDRVEYSYHPNPSGSIVKATLRKDGVFRPKGSSGWWTSVGKGYREYYDPSF